MEANVLVLSSVDDYVSEMVSHELASLGKGVEVLRMTVVQWTEEQKGKWDHAILLNHCMELNDPRLSGWIMHVVEMEFPNPANDEDCVRIDAMIRRRVIEFYLNDIQGKEMLGADSSGRVCD